MTNFPNDFQKLITIFDASSSKKQRNSLQKTNQYTFLYFFTQFPCYVGEKLHFNLKMLGLQGKLSNLDVDAAGDNFHRQLAQRLTLRPAQTFWSLQFASHCSCQTQRNTVNYTSQRPTVGCVMLIMRDSPLRIWCECSLECLFDFFPLLLSLLLVHVQYVHL